MGSAEPGSGSVEGGEHRFAVRVYYEDTDLAGVVYYANYLRYIERARSELLRLCGVDQVAMKAEGVVFVVRRVVADYRAPARFDDVLSVVTRPVQVKGASLVLRQEVTRDATVLFCAEVTIAAMTEAGRPTRLPGMARAAFLRMNPAD